MHKDNLKIKRVNYFFFFFWCHRVGVSAGVVHFFPITLSIHPVQVSKHQNV